jgi:hypothetical protein
MIGSVPLGIPDRSVPGGVHVRALYGGSAGRDQVVMPFLAEGLRTRQKRICILDAPHGDRGWHGP